MSDEKSKKILVRTKNKTKKEKILLVRMEKQAAVRRAIIYREKGKFCPYL